MDNTRLIIKNRGTGKTTSLIYTSAITGYPIVVSHTYMLRNIKALATEMGITIPEPMTLNELVGKRVGRNPENVLLDEGYRVIGDALDSYLGTHVVAVTLTDIFKEISELGK